MEMNLLDVRNFLMEELECREQSPIRISAGEDEYISRALAALNCVERLLGYPLTGEAE